MQRCIEKFKSAKSYTFKLSSGNSAGGRSTCPDSDHTRRGDSRDSYCDGDGDGIGDGDGTGDGEGIGDGDGIVYSSRSREQARRIVEAGISKHGSMFYAPRTLESTGLHHHHQSLKDQDIDESVQSWPTCGDITDITV